MQSLTLLAMAACGAAQVPISNPNATIQTCSDLDTCDLTDTQSICQVNSLPISGVGIVPSIIDLGGNNRSATNDDRNLSLTLVDNGLDGGQRLQGFDQSSWKTLYVGSPPSVNLTEGPTGCALMMQYYQQTFPLFPVEDGGFSGVEKTDTACPFEFLPNCVARELEDSLRTFNYSGQDTERLPRCEALAQHVETTLHKEPTMPFCSYTSGLITVYGGAISGPDVQGEVASIPNTTDDDDDGCRPVQPQSHTLHPVTSAMQPLYVDSTADDRLWTGGRTGLTPIFAVFYGNNDSQPELQAFCMSLRSPEGNMLPSQSIYESGSEASEAAGLERRKAMWYAVIAVLLVIAWS